MLGKIPPFALGPVGLILIVALAGGGYHFLIQPKQAEIKAIQDNITTETETANKRAKAEENQEDVNRKWVTAHEGLAQKMDERSIPLAMGYPYVAMTNLWREAREDLPPLVEKFIRDSGCVLIDGAQGWSPPVAPLPADTPWIRFGVGPSGATTGLAVPGGPGGALWVAGTLADIERLYKSLRNFPRVMTISNLGVIRLRDLMGTPLYNTVRQLLDRPDDEIMVSPLILTIYLMTETPEAAAAPAAGGGPAAAGGAAPGGGGPPPEGPPSGEGGPPPS
jgi:hypothetical protein